VPRLGSYLAIKLEYSSCLSEESFDFSIQNYNEVNDFNETVEEKKRDWEEN
jgi:hypothetical protein